LWYLVGLIASDGCLSSDGRHIDITSSDYNHLLMLKDSLGLTNAITKKRGSNNLVAFHMQIANKNFYEFLLSIGLTPKKSLTIERVEIPQAYFYDFLRGLIDGDGGMQRWVHCTNRREQWNLRISSGSKRFLEWLQNEIVRFIGAHGKLYAERPSTFRLKFGKMAAREIIKQCYYKGCLGLDRKIKLAKECFGSYKGWSKSKTVHCELA